MELRQATRICLVFWVRKENTVYKYMYYNIPVRVGAISSNSMFCKRDVMHLKPQMVDAKFDQACDDYLISSLVSSTLKWKHIEGFLQCILYIEFCMFAFLICPRKLPMHVWQIYESKLQSKPPENICIIADLSWSSLKTIVDICQQVLNLPK